MQISQSANKYSIENNSTVTKLWMLLQRLFSVLGYVIFRILTGKMTILPSFEIKTKGAMPNYCTIYANV